MVKLFAHFYVLECQLFMYINHFFNHRKLNLFFRTITHIGGARFTISAILILILFSANSLRLTAIASAISLAISHVPVAFAKKLFPRKRPYLNLPKINVTENPLKDHSFPSGHTTAVFSMIIPFIFLNPWLTIILITIGLAVGLSRIYLGLHYPSDVIAGCILGCTTGILSFVFVESNFPQVFM